MKKCLWSLMLVLILMTWGLAVDSVDAKAGETAEVSDAGQDSSGIMSAPVSGQAVTVNDATLKIKYNGKKLNMKKTPVIMKRGVYMIQLEPVLCEQGPKLELEYGDNKHYKLIFSNTVVTFFLGDKYYYSQGKKYDFTRKPFLSEEGYCIVPLEDICNALHMQCEISDDKSRCNITGRKVDFEGERIYTKYAYSLKAYAAKEYKATKRAPLKQYIKYVSTKYDTTHNFKYLRIDRYRPVDKKAFRRYYQYLIKDYCRQVGISPKKSVLYGRADDFLKVAKEYNLDPVYFVNQTFQESAYGTTVLASGNRIKRVAVRGFRQNRRGRFITKKIKKTVKVYNLYGIKAYDRDPFVGGTSYAYYMGWTSVKKAIEGAAKYLKSNYIGKTNQQNTIFKMRYTFRRAIWHQYATDPNYAESIGKRIYLMSSVYSDEAEFLFDFPKYK